MRALDRVLALAAALAIAATGTVVAVETSLLARGDDPWIVPRRRWDRWLSEARWDDPGIRLVASVTVGVAAVVVLLQLLPRRPRRLALTSTPGRSDWIGRDGLQRIVARAVLDAHDEVVATRVRIGRRRVDVRGTVVASSDATTPDRVHETVSTTVAAVHLVRTPGVKVRLARNSTRVQ